MNETLDTYRGVVYPWHCDHMGHMNVMWYVGKFDEATWNLFSHLGLTPSFLRDEARGMAAVEQRIAYLGELHAGDTVAIRSGVVAVSAKTIRFFHELRKGENDALAAVTLLTGVHIDTVARKSAPLPEEVAAHARRHIVDYQLPW